MVNEKKINQRILVIDDDVVITKMIESRLKANGYEPIVSNDAAMGLEIAIKKSPDLIILDVMMPIINGYNMCSLIRAEKRSKSIPIIMLTSRSEDSDKAIGRQVGANAYITKPFNMDDLLQKIKEII